MQAGESSLVANLTSRNTVSSDCAQRKAGVSSVIVGGSSSSWMLSTYSCEES